MTSNKMKLFHCMLISFAYLSLRADGAEQSTCSKWRRSVIAGWQYLVPCSRCGNGYMEDEVDVYSKHSSKLGQTRVDYRKLRPSKGCCSSSCCTTGRCVTNSVWLTTGLLTGALAFVSLAEAVHYLTHPNSSFHILATTATAGTSPPTTSPRPPMTGSRVGLVSTTESIDTAASTLAPVHHEVLLGDVITHILENYWSYILMELLFTIMLVFLYSMIRIRQKKQMALLLQDNNTTNTNSKKTKKHRKTPRNEQLDEEWNERRMRGHHRPDGSSVVSAPIDRHVGSSNPSGVRASPVANSTRPTKDEPISSCVVSVELKKSDKPDHKKVIEKHNRGEVNERSPDKNKYREKQSTQSNVNLSKLFAGT